MRIIQANKWFHFFLVVILSITISACGGGSDGSTVDPVGQGNPTPTPTPTPIPAARNLQQIVISPYLDSVAKGGQVHFSTIGIYDDQSSEDISADVIWSVDDETLASVDTSGNVLPLKAGMVTVYASTNGLQAQRSLTINDVSLDSIQVIPQQVELANGMQQTFQAIGNYSDGSTQDLSQQVLWGSSDTQVVQMASAVAQGKSVGSAIISASLDGISGQAILGVNSAQLQRIEITLNTPSLEIGLSSSISVQGFYSDQSISDVTSLASWQIDDTSVISIDASTEIVKALAVGTATIQADVSGFQANVSIQVNDAVLSKIEISPVNSSLPAGYKQQLQATGIYSNQTSQDLTQQVTWVSSNDAVAEIDNRLLSKGEVTAVNKGSTIITAYFAGKSATADLTVSDAVLTSIDVSPSSSKVAMGLQQQFKAIALYSDGSQTVVTDKVEWSSASSKATLVGSNKPGLFQANTQGNVFIIAKLNNEQGFTSLEITSATLDSLSLELETDKQALGTTQQLIARGHYSDGSNVEVTDQVNWGSSNTSVARVSNADGSKGLVTALSSGSVSVTAQFESIQANQAVEITAAVLQQIQISASSTDVFYINQQRTLGAVGTYSDGSTQSLTGQVQWISSSDQVVAVSNAGGSHGLMTALSAGLASVSASFAGVDSNALSLQVIDDPNHPASISISATPNVILNNGADSTTLQATIQALQSQGVIVDGTEVNFIIQEDGGTRTVAATTVDGVASISLTSTFNGFILVTAEVTNTDLNATTAVYSTDNFVRVLQVARGSKVVLLENNTVYQQGSLFVLYIRNLSNRDFNVLEFLVKNGGVDFSDSPVTDIAYLSGGVLEGGEYTVAGYQLDLDTPNNTISMEYILQDIPSQYKFGFGVNFNTP